MNSYFSRRRFLTATLTAGASAAVRARAAIHAAGASPASGLDFPLIDFHAHVEGNFTLERALELAKARGAKLGLAEHAGCKEEVHNDATLRAYLARVKDAPVYKGIQAEGLDWMKCFSKGAIADLDYVLSDALTFPEKDGRLVHLWTPEAVITDKQGFMDRYVDFNVQVISTEPIDIFANPTFLPETIVKEYDALWTEARMKKVIDAAAKYGVAIEINSLYNIPSEKFLRLAKAAGVKFSFGSNAHGEGVGKLDYSIKMAKALGLRRENMFMPAPREQKPIMRRM
jgi:hypothetical protein